MKTQFIACLFFFILLFGNRLYAQEDIKQNVQQALAIWSFLEDNIQVGSLTEKTEEGKTIAIGSIAAFQQSASLEVTLSNSKKVEQLAINFPEAVGLDLQKLRAIANKDIQSYIPEGIGAAIRTERLEFDFSGRDISAAARIIFSAGTWAPFQGQDLKLSELKLMLGVLNPMGAKAVELEINGALYLPQELANYIDIGETKLEVSGKVNSETGNMSLGAGLSTEEIPIHPDKVVVLKEAKIEFYIENGDPGLAMGGQVEIRPPNQEAVKLDGELSIDLTGEIFGQGYMTGYWHNPLGLSDQLYIQKAGVGFGLDFKTTPYPMPIFALQGGFSVGSSDPLNARLSGEMTVGFHGGDPSKNMIDAQIHKANLNDVVTSFYPPGVPRDLKNVFKKVYLRNARLTIVPPGDGVELFGQQYDPGIHIQGSYDVDQFTGSMLISISEEELTAYAGICTY